MAGKKTSRVKVVKNSKDQIENSFPPFNNFLPMAGRDGGIFPGSQQLSNTETLFQNLRWYMVSNFRQLLSQLYVEIGLIQTIVDVPVDDAFRGGIEIKSKQLNDDQIDELLTAIERDDDLVIAAEGMKWTRLYGGGFIMILTDQDPDTPLDISQINENEYLEFRAGDLWELFSDKQNTDGEMLDGKAGKVEFYNYYGVQVHHSRVIKLMGQKAPSFVRPRLRGWGMSVVEKLVRSINQYLKSSDLSFEVLDEFKLDIYKIKNLVNTLLSPNGAQKVRDRVQMMNQQKNFQNAVTLDSEDDFQQKMLSFSGLAEVSTGIRIQVASDLRMPLTKLFGISAAGFNSGEDDIEVYNGMIESEIRGKSKKCVLRMLELKCQKLFGFVPDDLKMDFKPLRVLSAEQEEKVKDSKFNRLLQARNSGEITGLEFRQAVNKGNLMDITLDTKRDDLNVDELKAEEPAVEEQPAGGEKPAPGKNQAKEAPKAKEAKLNTILNRLPGFAGKFDTEKEKLFIEYNKSGGDNWITNSELIKIMNPGKVDEGGWSKAKEVSQKTFGEIRWPFVTWYYKKQGGTFK